MLAKAPKALADALKGAERPVIIVGGLRFGIFTPTEAAVVAAVYALAVSTLLYRELSWSDLMETLTRASRTSLPFVSSVIAQTAPSGPTATSRTRSPTWAID